MLGTDDIDLTSERFFFDPRPTFDRLLTEAPVYFFKPLGSFIISRYSDIEAFVKAPSFSVQRTKELLGGIGITGDDDASKRMTEMWSRLVLFTEPPRHTLLRQFIMKGFSPAAVERMRPTIASLVEDALEKARSEGEMDVVAEFAEPIAMNTLAALFGIPPADRPRFKKWSTDMLRPASGDVSAVDMTATLKQSSIALADYMMWLAVERRRSPGDDIVSRFIVEQDANPELAGEAALQSYQMVGAGYVSSMNQISNTVLALLNHPAELKKLREDRSLLRGCIEEGLRYDPSVLSISRLCVDDTEIKGTKIAKGQFVFAMSAAANRDKEVFPDPDRFDISRETNRHLTFGVGPHYCPGAPLIRMEVEEALRALLSLPRWELSDAPYDYAGSNFNDRGPSSLRVRFPAL